MGKKKLLAYKHEQVIPGGRSLRFNYQINKITGCLHFEGCIWEPNEFGVDPDPSFVTGSIYPVREAKRQTSYGRIDWDRRTVEEGKLAMSRGLSTLLRQAVLDKTKFKGITELPAFDKPVPRSR